MTCESTDAFSGIIRAFHDELDKRLAAASQETPELIVEGVKVTTHGAPPRVLWVFGSGRIVSPSEVAGDWNSGTVAIDEASFVVHIWGRDEEHSRTLLGELVRASYYVYDHVSVKWGAYHWVPDARLKHGRVLLAQVKIQSPISNYQSTVVQVATTSHRVYLFETEACDHVDVP